LRRYRVPSNIISHCLSVAKVAVFLARKFNHTGIEVNTELVEKAALLHDIARVCDFDKIDYRRLQQQVTQADEQTWQLVRERFKGTRHEQAAYEILKQSYPEVAETIRKHWYMGLLEPDCRPQSWEEKILFYADMRVMHDTIVPLNIRLEEGHKRNVHLHGSEDNSKKNTAKVDPLVFKLEKQICSKISIEPEQITEDNIDKYLSKEENLLSNDPELIQKLKKCRQEKNNI